MDFYKIFRILLQEQNVADCPNGCWKGWARACWELNSCGITALPFPGQWGLGKGWRQLGDEASAALQLCPAGAVSKSNFPGLPPVSEGLDIN